MKNFRTYNLAIEFYKECQRLRLSGPIKDQFERALLSIVCNLAEGSGKPTSRDRKKFYSISMGSLREVQALLYLANDGDALKKADVLGAFLYRLIQNPGGT